MARNKSGSPQRSKDFLFLIDDRSDIDFMLTKLYLLNLGRFRLVDGKYHYFNTTSRQSLSHFSRFAAMRMGSKLAGLSGK